MKTRNFPIAIVGCLVLAGESVAAAQVSGDAETQPAPSAPAPAPAIPDGTQPAVTPPGPPSAGAEKGTTPAAPGPKWYDAIAFDAFVDAYASINYNFPKPQTLTSGFGGNQFRAFDVTNGFALNWVGLNASYAPDPVGGTISLRMGPGARIYAGNDTQFGLEIVKQAFASWKPGGKEGTVTIDFGKYDQPYGSEVAETHLNMNYSRSALYNYAQPLFFTGFRVDWQATEALDLKLIAANGWNNSVSQNVGKTGGIQINVKANDSVILSAGYALGPQQSDATVGLIPPPPGSPAGTTGTTGAIRGPGSASDLRHLVDAIVDVTVANKVRFLLNGDYVTEQTSAGSVKWYGVNLGVRYAVTEPFGIAIRGEYFADPDGFATATGKKGTTLVDGTLTLEGKITPNLILKLEQRLDLLSDDAGDRLFQMNVTDSSKTQMTTMLGVVAKTN